MQLAGKVAIITGASSGIGRAAAKLFARHGANLVLTARRQAELEQLAADITAAGHGRVFTVAGDITDAALANEPRALAVVEQFCRFLGRVAGNNVLTLGARGGVYIVGGVIPRFAELFLRSGFAASFADKGCMSGYFAGVPVWLVTAEFSGLLGAGVALQQALDL